MNKVIRLTESDLVNIVKNVINEQTKISNDWMTNMKNSGSNKTACPIGFIQMSQKEISAYDKQLVKPWANTTDGSGDYKVINATTICRRTQLRNDPNRKLKTASLEEIVSGFRDIYSGVGGTIGQIIIAALGGQVVNMVTWGLLVSYDIYEWTTKGSPNWFNLLHDLFWLLLSGVGGKVMAALKPYFQGETQLAKILIKIKPTKFWPYVSSILSKLISYTSKVLSLIKTALTTIISKIPSLKPTLKPLINSLGSVGIFIKKIAAEYAKSHAQGQVLNATAGQLK